MSEEKRKSKTGTKNHSSRAKAKNQVQTTLSKFFTSASDDGVQPGKGCGKAAETDVNNDFQIAEDVVVGNKRSNCSLVKDEVPAKKFCASKQRETPGLTSSSPGVQGETASSSREAAGPSSKNVTSTSSRLQQFEFEDFNENDKNGRVFEARHSGLVHVEDRSDDQPIELDSRDSEDEEKLGSVSGRLQLASSSNLQQQQLASSSNLQQQQAASSSNLQHQQLASSSNLQQQQQAASSCALTSAGSALRSQLRTQSEKFAGKKQLGKDRLKYTPLEQQFLEIKSQYPDTVLFVECGYKYRFFGEDAQTAARVLKIFCHMDHNFMTASIPVHRLFVHLRRVVAAGFKAGVVKQTETANLKAASDNRSGPFSRKLTALYTKSTLIGEDVTSTLGCDDESSPELSAHHFLMCVYQEATSSSPSVTGLVCIEPSTGDVVYDEFEESLSYSQLETRISHLQPVEILIPVESPESLASFIQNVAAISATEDDRIRVETLGKDIFSSKQSVATLSQFYSNDPKCLQEVLQLPKTVLNCLAALCLYLKDFQLEKLLTLTSNFTRFSEKSQFLQLSPSCLRNLEIFHNSCDGHERGSLYWVINHTATKFGARLLRKWLTQPLLHLQEIECRLDAVQELNAGHLDGLKNFRETLARQPDLERGLSAILHKKCSVLEFDTVTRSLVKVRKELMDLHLPVHSKLLCQILSGISDYLADVSTYSSQINSAAARDNDKANLFVDETQFPVVYARKQEIEKILSAIQDHRREIRLTLGQPGLNYVTVLQLEFLIEVKNNQLHTVPASWTQVNSTKTVSRFHSPFLVENYRKLKELREQLTLDATAAWQDFLDKFSHKFVHYKTAITYLATLDCLMSLAKMAAQSDFCRPHFDEVRLHLDIKGGRHPIISALNQDSEQFVPNNTKLDADGVRVMVISGPNMGGKSSYIRQVALISILAQIGSFVPAESASLAVLDAIHIRMGANDDIFKGRSTFMVEMQEAAEILHQATDRSLVIMDEMGRGTSTHDGVAIAYATLDYFITQRKCLLLFVTHFPMMSQLSQVHPSTVQNYHMAFLLNDDQHKENAKSRTDSITFLYQLMPGAADKSYGLNVARLAELSRQVVGRAGCKARELEENVSRRIQRQDMFVSLYKTREEDVKASWRCWKELLDRTG